VASKPAVTIPVLLNDRPATEALRELTRKFKRNANAWNQSLELVSKGWNVVAGATRLAADALASVTREAAQFDKAVREVATIADSATMPLGEINRLGKELSTTFGTGAVDQAKGLYQAISAGATDAAGVMDAANKLAIGGVTDVTTAIDGLTTVMNAWGASAGSATDVADTFFVAIKAGKTTAAELSSSIGAVASSASAAGVPVETLAAAAATLTTKGIATSEAMTSLRGIFSALGKDKKATAKEAKRLGIEFSQAALKAKGLRRFLLDIVNANGVTEKSLTRLFGRVEATNAVLALTAEGGKKFNEVLAAMATKSGAAQAAFELMGDSFDAKAAILTASVARVRINLGEMVTDSDAAKDAVAALADGVLALALQLEDPGTRAAFDNAFASWLDDIADVSIGLAGVLHAYRDARNEAEWHSAALLGITPTKEMFDLEPGPTEFLLQTFGDSAKGRIKKRNQRGPFEGPVRPKDVGGKSGGGGGGGGGPPVAGGGSDLITGVDYGFAGIGGEIFANAEADIMSGYGLLEEAEAEAFARREDAIGEHLRKSEALWADHTNAQRSAYEELTDVLMSGTESMITDMATAIGRGSDDLDEVLKQSLGGIMQNLGSIVISLGVAGVAAGTLGSVVPALKSITGGELGIAGGLAAIGVGAGLVAGGSALSGGASDVPDARNLAGTSGGGALPASSSTPAPTIDAPRGLGPGGGVTNVFEVSFHNVLPGSERRIARELRRYLRDGDLRLAG